MTAYLFIYLIRLHTSAIENGDKYLRNVGAIKEISIKINIIALHNVCKDVV